MNEEYFRIKLPTVMRYSREKNTRKGTTTQNNPTNKTI